MPLIKREVEPVFVSQVDILGKDIKKDELECVTNYTLASIIRQLGNLGKHAEDIFGDLLHEATSLARRAGSVQDRLDKMTNTLNNLDPLTDSVSLRDINTRLAFQSSLILDAEVVSSPTMPSAMKATYTRCEQPPRLSQLNQFRQDGKDGLKFYTDPKFFFERWVNEQRKDIDNKKKKRKKKRPHSSNVSRPKQVQKRKDKFKDQALGAEFVDIEREKLQAKAKAASGSPPPNAEGENKRQSQLSSSPSTPRKETPDSARKRGPQRPSARAPGAPGAPGAPPPPPPPISNGVVDDSALPPPPPLDDEGTYSEVGDMPPPPPAITGNIAPPPPGAPGAPPVPAPPPPVPTSAGPAPPPPPPLPGASSGGGGPPLPKQNSGSANPRPTTAVSQVTAPRDDLLSAIKQGMQLRRVDVKVKDRPNEPENNSVEAILRRRIAVELSSDEETGSEFCSDDSEWEDDD